MKTFGRHLRRWGVLTAICLMTFVNSGCTLTNGFIGVVYEYMIFWETLPVVPVTPYQMGRLEDQMWEDERYNKVPVLDPIEGENAPIFCIDPPSDDQIMRALPEDVAGGIAFLQETQRNNVRIVVERIVDRLDECKVYPLVGPARLHHCHWKCTVYYDKTIRSYWPIPLCAYRSITGSGLHRQGSPDSMCRAIDLLIQDRILNSTEAFPDGNASFRFRTTLSLR